MRTDMRAQLRKKILVLVPFILILIVSYLQGTILKKQILITSDSLYMYDLSQDLLNGGSLLNWNLTQAPDYFPHMLAYLLISVFTKSATTQLFLITLFQIISLCSLLYIIFRELRQTKYSSILQSIGLLTLINLFQLQSTEWIYFYKTNNHFSSVLLGLLALFLLLRGLNRDRVLGKRMLFAISITIFLGTVSTITYIYAISIPIFIVLAAKLRQMQDSQYSKVLKATVISWFAILPFSTISALLVTARSTNSGGLQSRLDLSNFDFLKAQSMILASLSRNLVSSGVIVRIICLLIICIAFVSFFIFFLCRNDTLLNLNHSSSLLILLQVSVCSLLSSSILTLVSAGIIDEYFLRYFWPSIIMLLIFASVFSVQVFKIFQKNIYKKLRIELYVVLFLLILFGITSGSIQTQESSFQKTAKCLSEIRNSGVEMRSGVADYWYGRSVDYLSSSPTRTFVALNSLDPFYWMTTNSYYNSKLKYNYILLHTQPDPFGFNYESMKSFLPLPSRTFTCQGTDIEMYLYTNDSLNGLVQHAIKKYSTVNQVVSTLLASPGIKYSFSNTSGGLNGLHAGWSEPEAWGVWSIGKSSTLKFVYPKQVDKEQSIIFEGIQFPNGTYNQRLDIKANGIRIGTHSFSKTSEIESFRITIPAYLVNERSGVVSVTLSYSNPVSPKSLSSSNDDRVLAFGLVSVRID